MGITDSKCKPLINTSGSGKRANEIAREQAKDTPINHPGPVKMLAPTATITPNKLKNRSAASIALQERRARLISQGRLTHNGNIVKHPCKRHTGNPRVLR